MRFGWGDDVVGLGFRGRTLDWVVQDNEMIILIKFKVSIALQLVCISGWSKCPWLSTCFCDRVHAFLVHEDDCFLSQQTHGRRADPINSTLVLKILACREFKQHQRWQPQQGATAVCVLLPTVEQRIWPKRPHEPPGHKGKTHDQALLNCQSNSLHYIHHNHIKQWNVKRNILKQG